MKDFKAISQALEYVKCMKDDRGYPSPYAETVMELLSGVLERQDPPPFVEMIPVRDTSGAVIHHKIALLCHREPSDRLYIDTYNGLPSICASMPIYIDKPRAEFLAKAFKATAEGHFQRFMESLV